MAKKKASKLNYSIKKTQVMFCLFLQKIKIDSMNNSKAFVILFNIVSNPKTVQTVIAV
jgi:hypothetical protein